MHSNSIQKICISRSQSLSLSVCLSLAILTFSSLKHRIDLISSVSYDFCNHSVSFSASFTHIDLMTETETKLHCSMKFNGNNDNIRIRLRDIEVEHLIRFSERYISWFFMRYCQRLPPPPTFAFTVFVWKFRCTLFCTAHVRLYSLDSDVFVYLCVCILK